MEAAVASSIQRQPKNLPRRTARSSSRASLSRGRAGAPLLGGRAATTWRAQTAGTTLAWGPCCGAGTK
eukprot:7924894-Lingulodinium_polyedra.AAC.1